jgi:hypothetical protein
MVERAVSVMGRRIVAHVGKMPVRPPLPMDPDGRRGPDADPLAC